MIGAKVKLFCFAMFALFLKFGARTRPGDIWPFLISETGLKFLIWTKRALSSLVWTQGRIHTGNRVQVIRYPAWQVFEKEGKGSFRRERNARAGAREEGGKETPARRPLFPPSRLLIMYAKITQQWKTGCKISLAAKHLFLAFVLLKQEILSEGTYYKKKKSSNAVVRWKKKVATMRDLLYEINLLTSFTEGNMLDVETCMQCLSEKYLKHFASSRIGSSGAYKRTLVAGKEELNFEDLQESCNQLWK